MTAVAMKLQAMTHNVGSGAKQRCTLAPVTKRLDPGVFVVVAGPSGAGKTTLLSLLSRSVRSAQGQLFWGREDLSTFTAAQAARWRRDNIGLILQTSNLVAFMTAFENVRLAGHVRGVDTRRQGRRMMDSFGLGDRLDDRPAQLSADEKQRLAIAQTLACRPNILLADEPTTALAPANARFAATMLADYAHQAAAIVVCVSNDDAVISAADHVLHLEKP
ncbi:ABC transporter ATP-binding protein [Sphingomonas sp. 28-63-12]|uniref:ABC transporter ATP-binding protein n=1 Tax=Sphingomonas sp. 28-63-12 TaxID=1970434 RepID=UPI000BC4C3A7|nr:MAG: hypothetical protein B7Y47_00615 [Sphingomonas sp. 28-63-12]